eukprot:TRINITY_DN14335_c0_g1_i4.p1 TRINITY_DN14335_c0_g1~~TRINITY_DN14335_c0_g1_i4.p1  ORF type:complete len:3858 (+),score=1191.46 TRINITY_DN14335_c0_g1_i4:138-11711(+)
MVELHTSRAMERKLVKWRGGDIAQQAKGLRQLLELLEVGEDRDLTINEPALLEFLAEAAYHRENLVAAGRCLFLYGQQFEAFPAVWRTVLEYMTQPQPLQRLKVYVRLACEVINAEPGVEALKGHAKRVMQALSKVLDTEDSAEILEEVVPALSHVAAKAPNEFSGSFEDAVDLLLGRAVDATLPDEYRDLVNQAFVAFKVQWRSDAHSKFALDLQRKLLLDMSKLAASSSETGARLHALVQCFQGISKAMGNLGEIYGSCALVLLDCLRFFAKRLAAAPQSTAARDLRACVCVHLAAMQAARTRLDLAAAEAVLFSDTFRQLRAMLDVSLRRDVMRTYLVLLHSGEAAEELLLRKLGEELGSLLGAEAALGGISSAAAADAGAEGAGAGADAGVEEASLQQLVQQPSPRVFSDGGEETASEILEMGVIEASAGVAAPGGVAAAAAAAAAAFAAAGGAGGGDAASEAALASSRPSSRQRALNGRHETASPAPTPSPGRGAASDAAGTQPRRLSAPEVEALAAFDIALMRRSPRALPTLCQVLKGIDPSSKQDYVACAWETAGRLMEGSASAQMPLDDLLEDFLAVLQEGGEQSELLLRAMRRYGRVFWGCLSQEAQLRFLPCIWGRSQAQPPKQLLLDVALALCPLTCCLQQSQSQPSQERPHGPVVDAYLAAVQGNLESWLQPGDATGGGAGAAAAFAESRSRLLVAFKLLGTDTNKSGTEHSPATIGMSAADLRSLLATAAPLSGKALVNFLNSLRTLDSSANFAALFWASAMKPTQTPPAYWPTWLVLQGAAYLVNHRLKSPIGNAAVSLQALETLLVDAPATVSARVQSFLRAAAPRALGRGGASGLPLGGDPETLLGGCGFQPLACVQLVHSLEQLVLLAQEPVYVQSPKPQPQLHARAVCEFFHGNRRVCADWFQRVRGLARQCLARYGSHSSYYAVSLARLSDTLRQCIPGVQDSPLSLMVLAAHPPKFRRRRDGVVAISASMLGEEEGILSGLASLPPVAQPAGPPEGQGGERRSPARTFEALDFSLIHLLSSALALQNTGLCRGLFAARSHAAHLLGLPPPTSLHQDAFLAFAAQRYEDATKLFASVGSGGSGGASGGAGGGSRMSQALVARTWLDAAMLSQDVVAVEKWLKCHQDHTCVSPALRAYATAYLRLQQEDFAACEEAVGAALDAAVNDWSSAASSGAGGGKGGSSSGEKTGSPAERSGVSQDALDSISRLSRWKDVSNLFLLESSLSARTGALERSLASVRKSQACLRADAAARALFEPCVALAGTDAYEPNASQLELLKGVEGALREARVEDDGDVDGPPVSRRRFFGVAELQLATSFKLPALSDEADRLQLVRHCVRKRNFKMAASVLERLALQIPGGGESTSVQQSATPLSMQLAMHRSMLLEASGKPLVSALEVLHSSLSGNLATVVIRKAVSGSRVAAETTGLQGEEQQGRPSWLSKQLLLKTSLEGSSRECVGKTGEEVGALLVARYTKLLRTRGADEKVGAGAHGEQWQPVQLSPQSLNSLQQLVQQVHLVGGLEASQVLGPVLGASSRLWPETTVAGAAEPATVLLPEALLETRRPGGQLEAQVNPLYLGWLSLQGCLLYPSSAKLWAGYGDWLFAQHSGLDFSHVEGFVQKLLLQPLQDAGAPAPAPEDVRALCQCVRDAARRWIRRSADSHSGGSGAQEEGAKAKGFCRGGPLSLEWLLEKTKLQCSPIWQQVTSSEQRRFAAALSDFCERAAEWKVICGVETLRAYVQHLQLSSAPAAHPRVQQRLLRMLRVVAHVPEQVSDEAGALLLRLPEAGEGPTALPVGLWESLVPQLLAYKQHQSSGASRIASELFAEVARKKPHMALYHALASELPAGSKDQETAAGQQQQQQQQTALKVLREMHPKLTRDAESFALALNRMATPVDEVCQRLLQFTESFLVYKSSAEVADAVAYILDRFAAILDALDAASEEGRLAAGRPAASGSSGAAVGEELLAMLGVQPCLKTAYARRFLSLFLPALRRALFLHRPYVQTPLTEPLTDAGTAELRASLMNHVQLLLRTCSHYSKVSSVPLAELAPSLVEMFQNEACEVCLPISASCDSSSLLQVRRVASRVHLLSTKTKPKKLEFETADGSVHAFLLKGRDDLRLDGRLMQLLQAVSNVIAFDEAPGFRDMQGAESPGAMSIPLRVRDYDVVPIAPRAGLIRWVAAVPLFVLHRQRRNMLQERTDRSSEEKKRVQESSTDVWHRKIRRHLREAGVDIDSTPRRHWPIEALRNVFREMEADSPADLISRELLLSAIHPSQHFARCMAYTVSLALNSVVGHLIGLGDRHLDNVLLDLSTGEVVHVDYSICFDRGQRLRVPERVPFRLTRCMIAALGPAGVSGLFLETMENGLGLLRSWRELLLSLIEPCFLLTPVNDWVYPIVSPFKLGPASGGLICRLCAGLRDALGGGKVAEQLERFVQQCDQTVEAHSKHSGLKSHMTAEVRAMAEVAQRKSKAGDDKRIVVQQALVEARAKETEAWQNILKQTSDLQVQATTTNSDALARQRGCLALLLSGGDDAGAMRAYAGDDAAAVEQYLKAFPLEAFSQSEDAVALPPVLKDAALRANAALEMLKGALGRLSLGSWACCGLGGGAWESVSWCMLLHAPLKMQLDELCAAGLVDVADKFLVASSQELTSDGASGAVADVTALGLQVQGHVEPTGGDLVAMKNVIPAWSLEQAAERARRMLRLQAEVRDLGTRFEAWTAADGAAGQQRSSELSSAQSETRESLLEETQKLLRTFGLAVGGRATGLQRRRMAILLQACLSEVAELFEEAGSACHKKVSEFGLSAYVSQALEMGYPSLAPPTVKQWADEHSIGLPPHGKFIVLCARVRQIVQVLQNVGVLDVSHTLSVLSQRWQSICEALANWEACTIAASAVRPFFADLLGLLPNNNAGASADKAEQLQQDEESPSPAEAEDKWPSLGAEDKWPTLGVGAGGKGGKKGKEGKGKKPSSRSHHQGDLRMSLEKLCQELHATQLRLRTSLHAGAPAHIVTEGGPNAATLLGLPKLALETTLLDEMVELQKSREQLLEQAKACEAAEDGSAARLEMEEELRLSLGLLRSRTLAVVSQVDEMLSSVDEKNTKSVSVVQAMRTFEVELQGALDDFEAIEAPPRSQVTRSARDWLDFDSAQVDGEEAAKKTWLFAPEALPEGVRQALSKQAGLLREFLRMQPRGEDKAGNDAEGAKGLEPKLAMQVKVAVAEAGLIFGVLGKTEVPVLVSGGVELANATSHLLLPHFQQVIAYLFGFMLEQLHSLHDISSASVEEVNPRGIVLACSATGLVPPPGSAQDISQLCARRAHIASLLRRKRLIQGIGLAARATKVCARARLPLLQWCHIGSYLSYEAMCRSGAPGQPAELATLLSFPGLTAFDSFAITPAASEPAGILLELLQSRSQLREAIETAGSDWAASPSALALSEDLAALLSDVLGLFFGGLGPTTDTVLASVEQDWVRALATSLQQLLEYQGKAGDIAKQLQEMQPPAAHGAQVKAILGAPVSQAVLAEAVHELTLADELLEARRREAQQELDAFIEQNRILYSSAIGLAQPSLESSAKELYMAASAVISPLMHFRKVLPGSVKEPREACSQTLATLEALKKLRNLPASLPLLLQQCEAWLKVQQGPQTMRLKVAESASTATPSATGPGRDRGIPPLPNLSPKDGDDGDRGTTGPGSSQSTEGDDEEDDETHVQEEGEGTQQGGAGSDMAEEQLLAQDREEEVPEEELPLQAEHLLARREEEERRGGVVRSPLGSAASPEEDEEEALERAGGVAGVADSSNGDYQAAWRALAVGAVQSLSQKIPKTSSRVEAQAEVLIAAATRQDDLAQMYEGWTAWI